MPDGATAYQLRVVVAAEPVPDCLLIAPGGLFGLVGAHAARSVRGSLDDAAPFVVAIGTRSLPPVRRPRPSSTSFGPSVLLYSRLGSSSASALTAFRVVPPGHSLASLGPFGTLIILVSGPPAPRALLASVELAPAASSPPAAEARFPGPPTSSSQPARTRRAVEPAMAMQSSVVDQAPPEADGGKPKEGSPRSPGLGCLGRSSRVVARRGKMAFVGSIRLRSRWARRGTQKWQQHPPRQ